jgi:hypothetical protein
MINIIKRNLYILFSFVFFLFVSAFSFMPNANTVKSEVDTTPLSFGCYTCDGPYCTQAGYCGMTGPCFTEYPYCKRYGSLCGGCVEC